MRYNADALKSELLKIDGRGYPAYKGIKGAYSFGDFDLFIDHVQGDPFAAPSHLRVLVPLDIAGFPEDCFESPIRQTAMCDFLARIFSRRCGMLRERQGSGKSGLIAMDAPGQEILKRSSVVVKDSCLEARFVSGLPARGRRILGHQAVMLLCEKLPDVVAGSLYFSAVNPEDMKRHLNAAQDAKALRAALDELGLVGFVADGSILPRRSGVDDRPMEKGTVPFVSPDSMRVSITTPCSGMISGMGIKKGVTLIAGGGYHGKSTLLNALQVGVYNHVPGDGRERVVTTDTAVKIRAEDGRSVESVDIRAFIDNLPAGGSAKHFSTQNASGSTSQAANIMEAVEMGSGLLLLDEDTCATNLMIRDARMQALVEKSGEPITPYLDRIGSLFEDKGVSTILVLGGSGDYFEVADSVVRMDSFVPFDVTAEAKQIASDLPGRRVKESSGRWPDDIASRKPDPASIDPRKGRRDVSIKTRSTRAVFFGVDEVDMAQVSQLVDDGQLRAIGRAMDMVRKKLYQEPETFSDVAKAVCSEVQEKGLDILDDRFIGDYVEFRPYELAAAINRLRTLRIPAGDCEK